MTLPDRLLIVLFGAIGDVTRALPLATRIKRANQSLEISWAVEPASYELVRSCPAVDKVFLFERGKGFSAYLRFIREIKAERFPVVLDLQRHLKSGCTSFFSRAPVRVGFHPRNTKECNFLFNNRYIAAAPHYSGKIYHYQLFGDFFGLPKLDSLCAELPDTFRGEMSALVSQEAAAVGAAGMPRENRVALIIGGQWQSRIWHTAHYQRFITTLYEREGVVCFLIGNRGEAKLAGEILSGVEVPVVNLVEKTKLIELPSLFREMSLVVGSDSGPAHIAAAVGVPVIGLFGPTTPLRSAAYGGEQRALQSPVACSPCYRRECPGLNRLCMESIAPDAVYARVMQLREGSA